MSYSLVGIAALLILLITHFEIIFKIGNVDKIPAYKQYRFFIIFLAHFYITDILWGIFDHFDLDFAGYIITVLYFTFMSISVFFWAVYVVQYLEERKSTKTVMSIIGLLFPIFTLSIIIANFFTPIFFEFVDGEYIPHAARYAFLSALMALYVIIAIYSFISGAITKSKIKTRYMVIGFFGFVLTTAIILQLLHPNLPLYALGCAVGVALIKTYVVNNEKNELAHSLSSVSKKIEKQEAELSNAKELAYTDSLTGARSKHAYVEIEEELDNLIRKGDIEEFAVVEFDLNYLKKINDTLGHDVGDQYIIESYNTIKEFFKYSDIYRYGGDEFVIVLEGVDYAKRKELIEAFKKATIYNKTHNKPVVACGMADFNKDKDNTLKSVFNRADLDMYSNKKELKANE